VNQQHIMFKNSLTLRLGIEKNTYDRSITKACLIPKLLLVVPQLISHTAAN